MNDVTFGVLYEQVKASQQLKVMINNLINYRIGKPLETLINTSNIIESNQELISAAIPNKTYIKFKKDVKHLSL